MADITPLPQIEADKLRAAVEAMRRTLPLMIEYEKLNAQVRRARYLALVAEGFTPEEALEIVKCSTN